MELRIKQNQKNAAIEGSTVWVGHPGRIPLRRRAEAIDENGKREPESIPSILPWRRYAVAGLQCPKKVLPPRPRIIATLLSGTWRAFQFQADVAQVNYIQNVRSALGVGFHSGVALSFDRFRRKRDDCLLLLRQSGLNVRSGTCPYQCVIARGNLRRSNLHSRRDSHGWGFLAGKSGRSKQARVSMQNRRNASFQSPPLPCAFFPPHEALKSLQYGLLFLNLKNA